MRKQGPNNGKRPSKARGEKGTDAVGRGGGIRIGYRLEEDFVGAKVLVYPVAQGEGIVRAVDLNTLDKMGDAKIKHIEDCDGCLLPLA